jgi:spermidine synthase
MKSHIQRTLFLLFFLSGFCSLLYQVVWMRLAFASFGVITPVMSVVISVFMLGLAVGSWAGGRWIKYLTSRSHASAAYFYAAAEALIGLGALCVAPLFGFGQTLLLNVGESDSNAYLFSSAVIMGLSLLPWCICMGTTFPFMMAFVKEQDRQQTGSFSFLYLANVAGAMCGTLISALILIELLGIRNTLVTAAIVNLLIAAIAVRLGMRRVSIEHGNAEPAARPVAFDFNDTHGLRVAPAILFLTGFVSMSLEVIWTRNFTPVLGTTIYSFAELLFIYLFATWIGSQVYRRQLRMNSVLRTDALIGLLGVFAFLPVLLNDPRLQLGMVGIFVSVFLFCRVLGYLTPKLIDAYAKGNPELAGRAYAYNVIGCILGPLFASYVFLPTLGVRLSMVLHAVPFAVVYAWIARGASVSIARKMTVMGASAVALVLSIFVAQTYEERVEPLSAHVEIRRDHTATIISTGEGLNKRLFVNGVGITSLTPITKMMAHFPLALLDHRPESALVICFGMGTTFRSLASWGIDTTAIELVPSVKEAFPFYFNDAAEIMKSPNVHVIVDDGRRFLKRTTREFDVITLDPPPPIEAAASSLLYSEEFYELVNSHLKKDGLLQQWFPSSDPQTLRAVAGSLMNSFPHVRAFTSIENWGTHFIASNSPIPDVKAAEMVGRLPEKARHDLVEWNPKDSPDELFGRMLSAELDIRTTLQADQIIAITDNRPYNEYYFVRRTWSWLRRTY